MYKCMINSTRVINEPCIRTFRQYLPLTQHYKLNSGRKEVLHGFISYKICGQSRNCLAMVRVKHSAGQHLPSVAARRRSTLMEHARIGREEIFMAIEGGKKKPYTVADIETLPEGERAELIDGELFVMEAPTLTHQEMLGKLYLQIRLYIKKNRGPCRVLPAPFAVYIRNDEHNYVEPDISVICDPHKLDERGCYGAPDWVIEIVSPSGRYMDCVRKLALYEEAGVREYWIVDPQYRTVTVYNFERKEGPEQHTFSEKVKASIYEDFYIDFSEQDQ